MTILSTDLKVLTQRGYNGASATTFYRPYLADLFVIHQLVERILPQQKAERQAAEKAEREKAEKAKREEAEKVRAETSAFFQLEPTRNDVTCTQTKIPITQTNTLLPSASTVIATPGSTGRERTSTDSPQTSAIPELGPLLHQNRSDAALYHLVSPSAAQSSGEIVDSPQLDPTITSLSNIGTPLETDISGFHPMFHFI